MINNYTSSSAVIAKIISDLNLEESNMRITDMREWLSEGMEKIGAIEQLDHKVVILAVEGFLAKLPIDLYRIGLVAFSFNAIDGWLPMRKGTNSFGLYQLTSSSGNPTMLIADLTLIPLVKSLFSITDDREALDKLNSDINIRLTLSTLLNSYTVGSVNGYMNDGTSFSNRIQYITKPGYIVTNIPTGYIKVSYSAIVTDEEGMPLIPDNPSYFEALYWYVTMKLRYPDYESGKMPRYVYYDIRNSWNFYRKQAYAEAMMPSEDDLETIKNIWHTLVPEMNEHDTFFNSTGDQLNIYNHNN